VWGNEDAADLATTQVRLVAEQTPRVLVGLIALDGFIVWLLNDVGLLYYALSWVSASIVLQALRWRISRRPLKAPGDAVRAVNRLVALFTLLGIVRAAVVPLVFSTPADSMHYVFTMVIVGQMAGAVGTVGGLHAAYVLWGLPVAGTLAIAWWMRGTIEDQVVAMLILLLFIVLQSYVKATRLSLSEFVRLNRSLRTECDRAEMASHSKTRFFAAASHDLRQPLHALSINATTLELVARRQGDPMIRELSQSINRALQQSNGLLDALLDISRLDSGVMSVDIKPVELGSLVESVIWDFRPSAAQKGLKIYTESGPHGLWARTDPDLMRRVLNNLLSNAVKFTERGSIHVGVMPDVDAVVVAVQDTGVGISQNEHARVFEEFYQVGNSSRNREQGLGLGLAIVQRVVALVQGEVLLTSALGTGTRVEIRLPSCAPEDQSLGTSWLESGSAELRPLSRLPTRVLAIDDEPEILKSLNGLLSQLGCTMRGAATLAQAHAAIDEGFIPDALLVDFRLRDEDGLQAIRSLKDRLGDVPALLVTGDTGPGGPPLGAASGWRVVHKPLEGMRLARELELAMSEASTRKV